MFIPQKKKTDISESKSFVLFTSVSFLAPNTLDIQKCEIGLFTSILERLFKGKELRKCPEGELRLNLPHIVQRSWISGMR